LPIEKAMAEKQPDPILRRLMAVIEDRKLQRPADSYTTRLFDGGAAAIWAKVREEAEELIEAASAEPPDRQHVVHEAADLLFHTLVLLANGDVKFEDVEAELARRFGTSGLIEKASRSRTHP
jgi:phosphoribosyl-ATP pyrophosphohydrolase